MSEQENTQGGAGGPKRGFFKRRKTCPFSGQRALTIDWKDVRMLGRFISERGKMMPSRITAVSTNKQRELAQAIKRARYMALLPYLSTSGEAGGGSQRPGYSKQGKEYGNAYAGDSSRTR